MRERVREREREDERQRERMREGERGRERLHCHAVDLNELEILNTYVLYWKNALTSIMVHRE